MEDAGKKLYHRVTSLCKYLLCNTDIDSKAVVLTLQDLLSRWNKYKKASCPGSYLHVHRLFIAHKRSCGKVMFLHLSVSYSVHRGSVSEHAMAGGVCPWVQGVYTPLGRHPLDNAPLGQTPPQTHTHLWTPPETDTSAGGAHPTGMHSCFEI